MLFNSYPFIFAFLPLTVTVYFALNRFRLLVAAKIWLALSSLFFYSWWNISYLPLILASITFNYVIGRIIQGGVHHTPRQPYTLSSSAAMETAAAAEAVIRLPLLHRPLNRLLILLIGVSANLLLLGYYKYADFFIHNINTLLGTHISALKLLLPLGISFFTFTQIAYLIDAYKSQAKEYNYLNYTLFVTFYPHLIAGPILHHKEMMPQFDRLRNKRLQLTNVGMGIYIFAMGLFKKVVIADTFAVYANNGFKHALYFAESWAASLSYTLQIYFDFSGYTDMAIGAALMFNIRLPSNFNSPYKSLNIQDFWRRWHMTLSRFLRDYIYIPLGGNRKGETRMLANLMLTFLIGGLWHEAGWTFLFWGFLHGAALIIHRLWRKLHIGIPKWLAWFITFQFINMTWIFFRAENWHEALRILKGMAGWYGFMTSTDHFPDINLYLLLIGIFVLISICTRNSIERLGNFEPKRTNALIMALLFTISLLYFNKISPFLYFNF